MSVEVVTGIGAIKPGDWNALAGSEYPFLRHEFLLTAERTGCVAPDAGWTPLHVTLRGPQGELRGAMPLYRKDHSWGEFVFDWAWAQAFERVGLPYYPKLVSAAPFTPAPSPKLLLKEHDDAEGAEQLIDAAIDLGRELEHSSLHVQFPAERELETLRNAGMKLRRDCQFHWHNRGYKTFDDFIAQFSSKKRKNVRRDRRRVHEQGISFRWLHGDDIDSGLWRDIYQLISTTFLRRGGLPYLNLDFFRETARRLPKNLLVILAEQHDSPIAAAVFFRGNNTLYGRYWGSDQHYDALHFETCYYQGIDFCIANSIGLFEPGTQGEHKISRGFEPVTTWSAHWLRHPEFFSAIGSYLEQEGEHIDDYIEAVRGVSPFRADRSNRPTDARTDASTDDG